jgi:hypothetical protein
VETLGVEDLAMSGGSLRRSSRAEARTPRTRMRGGLEDLIGSPQPPDLQGAEEAGELRGPAHAGIVFELS